MSDSEDDKPLKRGPLNGASGAPKSSATISKKVDAAMDREVRSPAGGASAISLRNGPVQEMDVDKPNGAITGKRKSRGSLANGKTYKEASDSEDAPLNKRRCKSVKQEASDSDDAPLAKVSGRGKVAKQLPRAKETSVLEDDDDSDVPLEKRLAKTKAAIEKRAEAKSTPARKGKKADSDDEDDAPLSQTKRRAASNGVKATAKKAKKEGSDDDQPLSKAKGKKVKQESGAPTPAKKGKAAVKKEETPEEEDEEEDGDNWWNDPTGGDGTIKWQTLEHSGVTFPPPYEPLPSNVKLYYDGKAVSMHPDAEEVAGFYGAMLNSTVNVTNPTFNKNFFSDFRDYLKKTGGAKDKDGNKVDIKDFEKCDFSKMFAHFEAERERKKAMGKDEKKAAKAAKDEAEAPFQYCIWDGKKEKVGNFRVEPPALFRGRGEHPKTGRVKKRVMPEQITINIGKSAMVPAPPEGHKWKEVKHDQEGTWLAMWKENINDAHKYVMLAATSAIKGKSDFKKFEKARELKKHIGRIRKDYLKELKSDKMADRQRATAMYLIDKFALRAGNEKGDDEADTVGCCSLKFEHIELEAPNKVTFDFLGKDSIRFHNEFLVETQVFKNLRIFKKAPKGPGDDIFDRLTTSSLNKHLQSYMAGLTAKVFRTYNASNTFSELLQTLRPGGTVQEKVKEYNDANREVAIICNHKRTVGAAHAASMERMGERIKGLRYQRWRLKQQMLALEPKLKKKRGAEFFSLASEDIDQEWIEEHQRFLVEEEKKKIEKKFAKENEKLAADGKKEMKAKELDERLKALKDMEKEHKKENKSGKVEPEGRAPSVEKCEANLEKLSQRIHTMELQAQDKEENKEVALGTSKINYIDPRLTAAFCKKFDLPIEKLFNKSLREKFEWAMKSAGADWKF